MADNKSREIKTELHDDEKVLTKLEVEAIRKSNKELTLDVKVELDTSQIISSMKAVQRLSKNINKAFKEYENEINKNLNNFTDEELLIEIDKRGLAYIKKDV